MIATRRLVSDPAPSGEVNISSLDTEDSDVGDAAVLLDGDYRLNLVDVPYGNPSGDVVSIRNGAGAWHPATGTSPPPGSTCTIGGLGKIDYPAASANDLAAGPLSELCAIHR